MKKIIILMLFCICSTLPAQKLSMDIVKDMKPRNIGPGGMSGRVTAIDVVLSNPDVIMWEPLPGDYGNLTVAG